MSATDYLIWFILQTVAITAVIVMCMAGVAGVLRRDRPSTPSPRLRDRLHELHERHHHEDDDGDSTAGDGEPGLEERDRRVASVEGDQDGETRLHDFGVVRR